MLWALVPEAPVDEYGEPPPWEDDVRGRPNALCPDRHVFPET
jgi:hypothetical protein